MPRRAPAPPPWWPARMVRLGILPATQEERARPGWFSQKAKLIHEAVKQAQARPPRRRARGKP